MPFDVVLSRNEFHFMPLICNRNHAMRLTKIFILINENEIHQFLYSFHDPKCYYFHAFHMKVIIRFSFFILWKAKLHPFYHLAETYK